MSHSDSDDEGEEVEFDVDDYADVEAELDERLMEGLADVDEASDDGDDDSATDDSDDVTDDDDDDDDEPSAQTTLVDIDTTQTSDTFPPLSERSMDAARPSSSRTPSQSNSKSPSPMPQFRFQAMSPEQIRRRSLRLSLDPSLPPIRSFTVEAICALPHPVPTHALASSACMTHMITGSDDGYIRNYDIFSAVNGKALLTAPQRHHAGVVEGILKAGQLRFWWENPNIPLGQPPEDDLPPSPVYALAMHADALWALSGSDSGRINLFTVRQDPGRLWHSMAGHRGPVSALALDHDEKSFFSAGWDGEARQWDLNTGQPVRNFTAHQSQLAGIAVRPLSAVYHDDGTPVVISNEPEPPPMPPQPSQMKSEPTLNDMGAQSVPMEVDSSAASQGQPMAVDPVPQDSDAKSDASFDPLFDDEPEPEEKPIKPQFPGVNPPFSANAGSQLSMPNAPSRPQPKQSTRAAVAPRGAPPLLDPLGYQTFSPDMLMTVYIDGQLVLWDKRAHTPGIGVGRLFMSEKTPPWCLSACWSADGSQVYAGRRNGTIEIWDVRQFGNSRHTPRLLKTLRNPLSSGVVSSVVAFPDNRHLACASNDNLRLWNVADAGEPDVFGKQKSGVQFKIIPGHHGGYISQMLVDPGARFLISASSNRGWHGDSTRTVFVHDIKPIR
ncbi:hypothetical protein HGRIS_012782 [Hohenbuehelia grisea]|uniref:Transcription factor spt8 beta-propeller domain-containing protein n=1 Tax=Hohenbuehelia grisea TaxID=104357 RepID=A0ABR3ITB5_9AGAR